MATNTGGGAAAPSPARPRKHKKYTYGRNQEVKGGVERRARQRLKRTGRIKGVNPRDGLTGGEARRIKRQAIREGVLKPKHKNRRHEVDPFEREINAETRLQFGPQERELQYQRDQSNQFSQNAQGWYGQHVQDMQKAQAFQAGVNQGFQQAAYTAAQNAATADQSQNQQLLQQQQQSAAQRGTTVDPTVAAQLQGGVAARQVMGNAGGNLIGALGQANTAYMGNQVQVAGEQGLQVQADEANRRRKLDQLAADLAADKGAFRVKARRELQDTAHKQRLENAAFGLDVEQERNRSREARRDDRRMNRNERRRRMEADRKYRLDREKFGEDIARDRYQRRHGLSEYKPPASKGGSSGPRSNWTHGDRQDFDNAMVSLRKKDKKYGYTPADRRQVIDGLVRSGMTRRVATAAWRRFMRHKRRRPTSLTPRNPDGTPG